MFARPEPETCETKRSCGAKLSEGFARRVVAAVTSGGFGVVVPDRARGAYVVIVDRGGGAAEDLLMESPRYAEARRNGQLGAARVVVDRDIERRLIDRKPDALIRSGELAAALIESHAPPVQ